MRRESPTSGTMTPKGIEIVVNDVSTDRTLKSLIINFGVAFSIGRYNAPAANTVRAT